MGSLNKAMVIGRLGRDPEVRYTQSGTPVANFSIATDERWKDKSGEQQSRTEWHRIVCFGRQAEIAGEYLSKGRQVYVEGRIQTRDWEDKDGNKRYTTEIVANDIQFLGSRSDVSDRPSSGPNGGGYNGNNGNNGSSNFEPPVEDDIPF